MNTPHRAMLVRNRFGFTLAARETGKGHVAFRMFNFREQETDAITLPEHEARKVRDFLNTVYPVATPAEQESARTIAGLMERVAHLTGKLRHEQEAHANALRLLLTIDAEETIGANLASQIDCHVEQHTPERECCNPACDWHGHTARMLGDVGPLCPECGETTELAE